MKTIALFFLAALGTANVAPNALAQVAPDAAAAAAPDFATLAPTRTRAGHLRFATSDIHVPRAAAIFLRRLQDGNERADVRQALVDALPRTGGEFAEQLAALMAREPDARVRETMVATARRAPALWAKTLVRTGFADASAAVRAQAARSAATLRDGGVLSVHLVVAMRDADASVRAAAAAAIGVLGLTDASALIAKATADADADVRLASWRSLSALRGSAAITDRMRRAMAGDADARVRALAISLPATRQ